MSRDVFESAALLLTVLTPLCAVPLTVIVFYLRSLREQQASFLADLTRRIDRVESSVGEMRRALDAFERDFATKEEWLRECMQARRSLQHVTETTIRIEALLAAARQGQDAGTRCASGASGAQVPGANAGDNAIIGGVGE